MFIDIKDFTSKVRLRYRSLAVKCDVKILDGIAYIKLQESVYGVATGQTAVFYNDNKVIGSGWIKTTDYVK